MILQEDIIALTYHVRTFSEALSALRNTFIECEGEHISLCGYIKLISLYSSLFNMWLDKLCNKRNLQSI